MSNKTLALQLLLFIVTLLTTTLAGAEAITGKFFFGFPELYSLHFPDDFWQGLQFSVPFLGVLTCHEFGHFFVAQYHRVRTTLPYYIPMWLSGWAMSIGTLGAVIRITDRTRSRKQYFDIGIAGPLAGFVVAFGVLWYGFTHLPPLDYIYKIHPEYAKYGGNYAYEISRNAKTLQGQMVLGDNLLFLFFKKFVANPALLPPNFEIMHYPLLWAGYLSLFFTALNLFPIGQLDGGHILYGLIGKKRFNGIAPVIFTGFVFYAGLGFFTVKDIQTIGTAGGYYQTDLEFFTALLIYIYFLKVCFSRISSRGINAWVFSLAIVVVQFLCSVTPYLSSIQGFSGFFPFAFLLGRFLGVYHPDVELDEPLDTKRKILGWITLLIFVLCFTPHPFMIYDVS